MVNAISSASSTSATVAAGSSAYTTIIDQYAKTLAIGTTASLDDQMAAWTGISHFLDTDSSGNLLYKASVSDGKKIYDIMNGNTTDFIKTEDAAFGRLTQAQNSFLSETLTKMDNGEPINEADYLLKSYNKISLDDQKLIFCYGKSLDVLQGKGTLFRGVPFSSLDDYKSYLKTSAETFDRQNAGRTSATVGASGAPSTTASVTSALDSAKSQTATDRNALVSGTTNAALALQMLLTLEADQNTPESAQARAKLATASSFHAAAAAAASSTSPETTVTLQA
ncbi:MAG: hypothetical protein P4M00_12120 [Azospirillaceae bacterium]|nr:hypothetical protein [Azospirillaceae bacterium]